VHASSGGRETGGGLRRDIRSLADGACLPYFHVLPEVEWRGVRRTLCSQRRTIRFRRDAAVAVSILHRSEWESGGEAVSGGQSIAGACDSSEAATPRKWFVVHTRSRHEKVVAAQLRGRGIEAYLPLVEEIHRWSDRRKRVQVPLFPGYTFFHASESAETVSLIAQIESVVGIVGAGLAGTSIPDEQIEAIQRLVSHNIPCVNHPFLEVGQRVRIRGGALDGVEGILLACKAESSLVISIELIQRSLAVPIQGYDVEIV